MLGRQFSSANRSVSGGFRPGNAGIVVPDYYKDGGSGPAIIIPGLPLDPDYVAGAQGILSQAEFIRLLGQPSRLYFTYSQNSQFPVSSGNDPVAQAPVIEEITGSATRDTVRESSDPAMTASDHSFMLRMADAMKDFLNAHFRKAGQPTIEQAMAARGTKFIPDPVYDGEKAMDAVRRMCRSPLC